MRLSAPNVRIADVETCDFGLVPRYDTAAVLRAALPDTWERYLAAAVSRKTVIDVSSPVQPNGGTTLLSVTLSVPVTVIAFGSVAKQPLESLTVRS